MQGQLHDILLFALFEVRHRPIQQKICQTLIHGLYVVGNHSVVECLGALLC